MGETERIAVLEQENAALRNSNQWFREALDSTSEGIQVVDQKGVVTYVNRSFSSILGVASKERLGKNIFQVSPNGALVETLRTGKPSIAKLHTTLGEKKIILANATPIIGADGLLTGAISVFVDISDAERTSRLLEKRNNEINRLKERVQQLASSDYTFDDIIGVSPALLQCKKVAAKIAGTKMTVLLSGESGTGKELFAHSIHAASRRARGPFVKINCAAIPDNLLESEFFGYETGAFSGATKAKMGKFELANGGTLFLDEIGEMNYTLQAKLLRVLQDNEVERLGSVRPMKVDVRIIAATNKNLQVEIARGNFRKDLFYRLNEFHIVLPGLEDRKEDIPAIAQHYIEKYNEEYSTNVQLTPQICETLMARSWPGNVREMQNYLGKLVLFWDEYGNGETGTITMQPISELWLETIAAERELGGAFADMGLGGGAGAAASERAGKSSSLDELERQMILSALEMHGYDTKGKQRAAKELKISLSTLYNKLRLYKQQGKL